MSITHQLKVKNMEIVDQSFNPYVKFNEFVLNIHKRMNDEAPERVACALYEAAGNMSEAEAVEAEFLYLKAISLWEMIFPPVYPMNFTTVRPYAEQLYSRYIAMVDNVTHLPQASDKMVA